MFVGLLVVMSIQTDKISSDNIHRGHYEEYQYAIWGFYIFMICWVLELCYATSNFAVSYAVELWYFSDFNSQTQSKHHPGLTFSTCKGYATAIKHHMGTLAFG